MYRVIFRIFWVQYKVYHIYAYTYLLSQIIFIRTRAYKMPVLNMSEYTVTLVKQVRIQHSIASSFTSLLATILQEYSCMYVFLTYLEKCRVIFFSYFASGVFFLPPWWKCPNHQIDRKKHVKKLLKNNIKYGTTKTMVETKSESINYRILQPRARGISTWIKASLRLCNWCFKWKIN